MPGVGSRVVTIVHCGDTVIVAACSLRVSQYAGGGGIGSSRAVELLSGTAKEGRRGSQERGQWVKIEATQDGGERAPGLGVPNVWAVLRGRLFCFEIDSR